MNLSVWIRGSLIMQCLLGFLTATLPAVDTVKVTASSGATQWVLTNTPVPTVVDPALIVVNSSATAITVVTVVIGTGVDAGVGKDVLALPVTSGFSSAYDATTAILTITATSPATASAWQTILRTVTFSTGSRIAQPRTVSFALGSAKPYDGTGHFYEVVDNVTAITWNAARAGASARNLYGLQGYLATITSSGENSFIAGKLNNNAWMGAVDDATIINSLIPGLFADQNAAEGHWYWVTGPEAKTEFYLDNPAVVTPGPVSGRYNNWSTNEPNDFPVNLIYGEENFAHFKIGGQWNDFKVNNTNAKMYVVEYGGMPGDPAVVLQASRTVSVEWGAPSIAAPSGTQAVARPIISGGAAFGAGPGKVEVSLDLTANGSYDVVFVTTTANDGSWSINTASGSPTSGSMADLGPSAISRVRARLFNASAATTTAINSYSGPASEAVFTTDRLPPPAPIITGPLSPVNNLTPTLYGTAEPGATVTLTIDPDGDSMTVNSFVLITTAGVDGSWAVAATAGQLFNNETAAIVATASDAVGNISLPTNAILAVDISAPNAPIIVSPGATTNDRTPLINGHAEPGTTVNVVVDPDNNPATDNSITWVTIAAPDGSWFIDTAATPVGGTLPVGGFVDGTMAIQATATDTAGNISPTITTTTLLDATPPAAPQFTGPLSPTNDATPAITGTGEVGATLTLRIDVDGDPATNDVVTWIVPVASDGTWAIDTSTLSPNAGSMPGGGFPDGRPVVLSAVQTDAAGNTGPSAILSLAIDTTPPVAPTVLSPGPVTNNTRPTISGIAEPGSVVTIVFDTDGDPDTDVDRVTATTIADPISGVWSMTPFDAPANALTDGSLAVLEATATDEAGNTGPIIVATVIIDSTAPVPPTLTAPVPVSNQALPTLSGMIDDDTQTLVVVINPSADGDPSHQVVYTLTRMNGGLPSSGTTWSLNLATAIPDGGSSPIASIVDGVSPLVTLIASDVAANQTTSGASFLVDLSAPSAPTITSPGTTSADTTPTISGTAEANSLITVMIGGVTFVTVTNSTGLWQIDTGMATPISGTVPSGGFPEGTLAISVTATDAAGNTSTATVGSTVIDSLPPSQPVITAPGAFVADVSPLITGTAEPGSTITVVIDPDNNPSTLNDITYVVTASTSGAWSVDTGTATPMSGTFSDFMTGTQFDVTVQASDAAGNTSSLATTTVLVDTVGPHAPTVVSPGATTNDRTPLMSGQAEAGTTVRVVVDPDNNPATDNSVTWVTIAASDGSWFIDTAAPPFSGILPVGGFVDGTIAIQVTAMDDAGNVSPIVTTTTLIDATPPVAPQFTGPSSPTNDATPVITGTGEVGATLTLLIDLDGNPATDDVVTWIVLVASDGTWAINTSTLSPTAGSMPGGGFPDGQPVILSAVQTDVAGNTGPSATLALAIDTTPPAAPTVLAPRLFNNDNRPTISGIAEPGSLVRIICDTDGDLSTSADLIFATATADPLTGAWSMTPFAAPANALNDGIMLVMQVNATDVAGNTSSQTLANSFIDTVAPVPPALTAPVPVTNQALPTLSGIIDDDTQTLVVTINPGGVVYTLSRMDGSLPSSGTTWSLDLATAIPDGAASPMAPLVDGVSPSITLSATDGASNTTITNATFLVDLVAPAAPSITFPGTTSADNTPVISGTAEANSLVTVVVGGVMFVTVTNNSGLWQIDTGMATPISGTVPSGGFPEGTLAISVTATDAAGNTSTATVGSTVIDSLPPSQPVITAPGAFVADVSPLITGTAEPGSTITVVIDPDNNPSTLNDITYVVTASTSGAWSVDTGTATPMNGTFSDFMTGTQFGVTVQASDAAGNTSSSATTSALVVGGTGVATITLVDADRQFNGSPQVLDVTVTPVGLAMRILWRPASTPSATPVELDPANPAHAALWPSTVGAYSIQAIVVEPGWSGTTTATLVIFNQRAFDLEPNRCGSGVPIATALLLGFFLLLRFRSGLLSVALIAVAFFMSGQAMAEETPPVAPLSDQSVAPKSLPPQLPTPDSDPSPSPASTEQTAVKVAPIPEWWAVRVGIGPRTEAADERRSDDELTAVSWRHSSRVSLIHDYLPTWQRHAHHGPLLRFGLEGQSLSGNEAWLTPSNGDRLLYETRALGLNAMGFAGWELHTNDGWQIFAGPRISLGPVAARIHGELSSGSDKWSDDTWTIGAQYSYGAEGGISWRQNNWGLTTIVGYERQRSSLSYQLENSVDANDRGETWERRLDTIGWWWSIGLERSW